jgi:hypothetical protein
VTPRSKLRSWLGVLILILALALALVVGVAPAAVAAPEAPAAGKQATQQAATPSAAREVASSVIPLLLAGIIFLALLPSTPRYRPGSGSSQY